MVIGNTSFRLHGIDAPETDQRCLDAKCVIAACGIDARDRPISQAARLCCVDKGSGAYGRRAAVCSAWLVRKGLALAYRKHSLAYIDQEKAPRAVGRFSTSNTRGQHHVPSSTLEASCVTRKHRAACRCSRPTFRRF
jgi:endonuclease YncB( thermonuclease family)